MTSSVEQGVSISIHALREEGDLISLWRWPGISNFYPRPPRGGRLTSSPRMPVCLTFLSTPSARRATCAISIIMQCICSFLSTPSARRATCTVRSRVHTLRNFYPRPPRGGRLGLKFYNEAILVFLSTPSARRATVPDRIFRSAHTNFYPRPPRGGRHSEKLQANSQQVISIHALREEGDRRFEITAVYAQKFLSTPSVRRATSSMTREMMVCGISIHALREEGDKR